MMESLPDDRRGGTADAVQALVRALRRGKLATDRCRAIRSLVALGAQARCAVPDLVRALRDNSSDVREEACSLFAKIASPEPAAIDARLLLTATMHHHHGRFMGIWVLSKLPPTAVRDVVPALNRLLQNPWSLQVRPCLCALFSDTWLFSPYVDDDEFKRCVVELLKQANAPLESASRTSWFQLVADTTALVFGVPLVGAATLVSVLALWIRRSQVFGED